MAYWVLDAWRGTGRCRVVSRKLVSCRSGRSYGHREHGRIFCSRTSFLRPWARIICSTSTTFTSSSLVLVWMSRGSCSFSACQTGERRLYSAISSRSLPDMAFVGEDFPIIIGGISHAHDHVAYRYSGETAFIFTGVGEEVHQCDHSPWLHPMIPIRLASTISKFSTI